MRFSYSSSPLPVAGSTQISRIISRWGLVALVVLYLFTINIKDMVKISFSCYTCSWFSTKIKDMIKMSFSCYTCIWFSTKIKDMIKMSFSCYTCSWFTTKIKDMIKMSLSFYNLKLVLHKEQRYDQDEL